MPNLYMYQFSTKRTVPKNFGTSIKIPRIIQRNIVGGPISTASEGAVIGTSALSGQFISGVLKQFAGAFRHSDIVIFTALSDVVELSLRSIARALALKMDSHIRDQVSATGLFIGGNGAANSQSIGSTSKLKSSDIIKSVVQLDSANNPRPPDNHYPAIIHPKVVFDLQSHLSAGHAGAWVDVNKYATNDTVGKIYLGEIGRLYGARFVTSTNVKRLVSGLSTASISGYRGFMFAPDAYYCTEISDLTARTYIKQLGSAGTADPVNQVATVGAKVYFGVIPATWSSTENRMTRLMHTTTL